MAERPMHEKTNDVSSLPPRPEQSGALGGDETRKVDTVVFGLFLEFEQVKVRDDEGHIYALTPMTRGVDLLALRERQRIVCTVTQASTRPQRRSGCVARSFLP